MLTGVLTHRLDLLDGLSHDLEMDRESDYAKCQTIFGTQTPTSSQSPNFHLSSHGCSLLLSFYYHSVNSHYPDFIAAYAIYTISNISLFVQYVELALAPCLIQPVQTALRAYTENVITEIRCLLPSPSRGY